MLLGVRRENWFHYVLGTSMYALALCLVNTGAPFAVDGPHPPSTGWMVLVDILKQTGLKHIALALATAQESCTAIQRIFDPAVQTLRFTF